MNYGRHLFFEEHPEVAIQVVYRLWQIALPGPCSWSDLEPETRLLLIQEVSKASETYDFDEQYFYAYVNQAWFELIEACDFKQALYNLFLKLGGTPHLAVQLSLQTPEKHI